MAPAMGALKVAGEVGVALTKWSGVPDAIEKTVDKIRYRGEPPIYCDECKRDVAFRRYAEQMAIHHRNSEAVEQASESRKLCPFDYCRQNIRISKYKKHIANHIETEEAHRDATEFQQKCAIRSMSDAEFDNHISRTWVDVKTRNRE